MNPVKRNVIEMTGGAPTVHLLKDQSLAQNRFNQDSSPPK